MTTEFVAMKRAREREHTLQEKTEQIAEEAKNELVVVKWAQAKSEIENHKELKRLQQERDEAKEKYRILLAKNSAAAANTAATTATTNPAVPAAAAATTTVSKANIPGDFNLQEERNRLSRLLANRSLLSNLSSDLDRLQSQLRNQSRHSAFQLEMAKLTITSIKKEKAKAEEHIARLERDLQKAKAEAAE